MATRASGEVGLDLRVRPRWPWLLVASAWSVALLATLTGQDWVVNHHILIEGGRFLLVIAGMIFLLAWQLMTVAMMLPSSMPLMRLFLRANAANRGGAGATWAFLAGYAAVWTWFAVIAFCGDIMVHTLIHQWDWLAWHPWMIAGTTLITAGSFQFSPLKQRCLAQCRSPFGFLQRYYRRGTERAWWLGVNHGGFCLGCCWALMLVMFGLGVGNVLWMAGMAGVMVLEKTAPRGHHLVPVVGVVLIGWGAMVLVHPGWLPAILTGAA